MSCFRGDSFSHRYIDELTWMSLLSLSVSLDASKIDYQSKSQRKQAIYSEDYENLSSSSSSFLSTPTNAKPQHRAPDLASAVTSSSTTPVPSPEPALPSPSVRRRSMSPPLPPAMSPDNGRPLPHLPTNLTQPATDQQQIHIQLSIVDSTENPTKTTERSNMAGQVGERSLNLTPLHCSFSNSLFRFSQFRSLSSLSESKSLIVIN